MSTHKKDACAVDLQVPWFWHNIPPRHLQVPWFWHNIPPRHLHVPWFWHNIPPRHCSVDMSYGPQSDQVWHQVSFCYVLTEDIFVAQIKHDIKSFCVLSFCESDEVWLECVRESDISEFVNHTLSFCETDKVWLEWVRESDIITHRTTWVSLWVGLIYIYIYSGKNSKNWELKSSWIWATETLMQGH